VSPTVVGSLRSTSTHSGVGMSDVDRHRPLEQWLRLNRNDDDDTSVLVPGLSHEVRLVREEFQRVHPKVGGFGVVYHCEAVVEEEVVQKAVIKHMHYDGDGNNQRLPELNRDLVNEIALLRRVEEHNLTPPVLAEFVFQARDGAQEFQMLLQQEASGQSLFDWKDSMPTPQRIELLKLIFERFNLLHSHGMFHTDVDLHHIYWDERARTVHIIDWGGGFYQAPSDDTAPGRTLKHGGKEYWASPEQRAREPFRACSEVYLLGSLAYFFLTDDNNGDASPDYVDNDHPDGIALDPLRMDADIPEFLRKLVHHATRWEPEDRFDTVASMLDFWETNCNPVVGPILTVHTSSGEEFVVDETNTNLTIDRDLAVSGDFAGPIPTWSIEGAYEYLIRHGRSVGEWKHATKNLNIFQRPMLIRSVFGNVYFLEVTHTAVHASEAPSSESSHRESTVMYQCNKTGEIFVLVEDNGRSVSMKNQFTQGIHDIRRDEFDREYTVI
jgi:serine/threonine protein kinase